MSTTYPSKPLISVDIPEISDFSATFTYNYFVPDESETNQEHQNLSKPPRFVKLSFKKAKGALGLTRSDISKYAIADNVSRIISEQEFSRLEYVAFDLNDTQADGRLNEILSIRTNNLFPTLMANIGQKYKDLTFRLQLNKKILNTAIENAIADDIGNYADELSEINGQSREIQDAARNERELNRLSISDSFSLLASRNLTTEIKSGLSTRGSFRIVGYLIERYFVDASNKLTPSGAPIVINNPIITGCVDTHVVYGRNYVYKIYTICAFELPILNTTTNVNTINVATFLVKSNAKKVAVTTVDLTSPPYPADFNVNWDFRANAPKLIWAFPVNPQRDIKGFQVFRRTSISEPFELLREIKFDDSTIKYRSNETVEQALIYDVPANESPNTFYIDYAFPRNLPCIYTVCSIDAHGLTSNYAMQFEVTFDQVKGKVVKRLISKSGAPKQFPNYYLNADTFVDAMKTSGTRKVKVFFEPEYLSVIDHDGHNIGLLKSKEQATYQLNFINVDLQKSQTVNIILNDDQRLTKRN